MMRYLFLLSNKKDIRLLYIELFNSSIMSDEWYFFLKDQISISPIPLPPSSVWVDASQIPNFIYVSISKGIPLSEIEIAGVHIPQKQSTRSA